MNVSVFAVQCMLKCQHVIYAVKIFISSNPTASKKPKRRKKKNLFEVAQFLPNWGLGYHMAKTHWTGVSYEIIKINIYKDGRHGKA